MPSSPQSPPRPPEEQARRDGRALIAGVDEAGRGPWAGPVVAAAVIVPPACIARSAGREWTAWPVRIGDSKLLSPNQRRAAFAEICRDAAVGVGIVDNLQIDAVNIHQATLAAMAQALGALDLEPELVFVDGLHTPRVDLPCRALVDADQFSYSVACASIVAKVVRDEIMTFYHQVFPEYGFDRHKGYGTSLHLQQLQQVGPCCLHRQSFRPVWEAAALLSPAAMPEASDEYAAAPVSEPR